MSQIESDHKESAGQNLRKEAINWANPSKSRTQGVIPCIDSETSFIVGFFLEENSAGGGNIDELRFQWQNFQLFLNNDFFTI